MIVRLNACTYLLVREVAEGIEGGPVWLNSLFPIDVVRVSRTDHVVLVFDYHLFSGFLGSSFIQVNRHTNDIQGVFQVSQSEFDVGHQQGVQSLAHRRGYRQPLETWAVPQTPANLPQPSVCLRGYC